MKTRINNLRLMKPADALLPVALLAASLLARSDPAFELFFATYAARLCALATANALRPAFAAQPSVRFVQGSALTALLMQLCGAAIVLPLSQVERLSFITLPLLACGLLLNIEHVFYEYLYAMGDGSSAALCRSITSVLVLAGLLLGAPSGAEAALDLPWLLISTGLSALVALAVSISVSGRLRPRLSPELFIRAPLALLQTMLYPALALAIIEYFGFEPVTFAPLFAGLILYELCRTPFRRTPSESAPMNRALLICFFACALCLLPFVLGFELPFDFPLLRDIPFALGAVMLAALCAFGMYGSVGRR